MTEHVSALEIMPQMPRSNRMRILITGCAGFVGSHLSDKLRADGHDIYGIDDLSSGQRNLTAFEVGYSVALMLPVGLGCGMATPHFVQHDLSKPWTPSLLELVSQMDAVVHAASYPDLRKNWRDPAQRARIFQNGEVATINLLEAIPEKAPLIFLSSASVYGESRSEDPVVEADALPATIQSPYAASKLACEAYVAAWSHKTGRPWHVVRLVNVVGPRGHRGVIGDFVKMARTGHIHAADDGKQHKSWVHAHDVAEAVARLLKGDVPSGIYNVTSRERISWWRIVEQMGIDPDDVTFEPVDRGAVGDPHDLHASGEKLGPYYRCERSVIEGIQEALKSLDWEPDDSRR